MLWHELQDNSKKLKNTNENMKHLFHGNTKTDSNQFCQTICEEKIWYFTIIFNNPSEILLWHISNNSNNNHKNYNNLHAMW